MDPPFAVPQGEETIEIRRLFEVEDFAETSHPRCACRSTAARSIAAKL